MEKTIQEGNRLIAEFMGAVAEEWYPPNKDTDSTGVHLVFKQGDKYPDNQRHHPDSCLKYHSDWDWLMPVCIKLRMDTVSTDIDKTYKHVVTTIMEANKGL